MILRNFIGPEAQTEAAGEIWDANLLSFKVLLLVKNDFKARTLRGPIIVQRVATNKQMYTEPGQFAQKFGVFHSFCCVYQ